MLATDRARYTTASHPYDDAPQGIQGTAATISAPHMHAHSLEQLSAFLRPGASVLDVGCGSGYLVACMARMVGSSGSVVGIDHLPSLTDLSSSNLGRDGVENVKIVLGDGWQGYAQAAPFQAIHVGAAAVRLPEVLVDQLARPGRMVCPVGPEGGEQAVHLVDKDEAGRVTVTKLFGVRYVPLVITS